MVNVKRFCDGAVSITSMVKFVAAYLLLREERGERRLLRTLLVWLYQTMELYDPLDRQMCLDWRYDINV